MFDRRNGSTRADVVHDAIQVANIADLVSKPNNYSELFEVIVPSLTGPDKIVSTNVIHHTKRLDYTSWAIERAISTVDKIHISMTTPSYEYARYSMIRSSRHSGRGLDPAVDVKQLIKIILTPFYSYISRYFSD